MYPIIVLPLPVALVGCPCCFCYYCDDDDDDDDDTIGHASLKEMLRFFNPKIQKTSINRSYSFNICVLVYSDFGTFMVFLRSCSHSSGASGTIWIQQ